MLQGLSATLCGDYCIIYFLLKRRGWQINDIVPLLTYVKRIYERDHVVRTLVTERYRFVLWLVTSTCPILPGLTT